MAVLGKSTRQGISKIIQTSDLQSKMDYVEELCARVIEQIKVQGLSQDSSDFLVDQGPQIQNKIRDPEIRSQFHAFF